MHPRERRCHMCVRLQFNRVGVNLNQHRRFLVGLALILLAAPIPVARAQAQKAADATNAAALDPEAVASVEKMQTFLKTLTAYSIHVETTTDEVLVAGPKVQFGGTIDCDARLPNRLHLTVARDDKETQEFFYDGTNVAVWIKDRNVWAGAPVAPTVGEMLTQLRSKYTVSFPLDDLLRGAAHGELLNGVTAAVMIGTGIVGGAACDHLGFHRDGIDVQLWIEQGDSPLPRKRVITTLDEASQPQHSEIMTWNLAPKLDDTMFSFTPPAGAEKIVFAESKQNTAEPKAAKKEGAK